MGTQISPLHVRRSLLINASPQRVWQEFTTFERFKAWFGTGHELLIYEPKLGGDVELSVDISGEKEPWRFGGPVIVFEEARELSFEDAWKPPQSQPVPTLITIRLTSLYSGTHVELFHHGWDRFGAEAGNRHEGVESSWDAHHLQALRNIIEG